METENATHWDDMPLMHQYKNGRILMGVLIFESCLILAANSLVFVLVSKYKKLRRKNNYCLISLAVADISAGLVSLPMIIACSCTNEPALCHPMDFWQRFISFSTIIHLLVATGERYFKISYPLRYKYYVTGTRIILILLAVWIVSLPLSLIQLAWIDHPDRDKSDLIYSTTCLVLMAFLPFFVIIFANAHMLWNIRKESELRKQLVQDQKHRKSQKRRKNERKALIVYMAMSVSFMVGWLPYFILTLLHDTDVNNIPHWGHSVLIFLKFSSAFINPLLYTFFKTDFQNSVKDMLSKPEPSQERTAHTRL